MKLFDPIEINGMTLKNRICQAPMLEAPDVQSKQAITDDTIEWYESRARGGAGFVMTGCMFPFQLQIPAIVEGIPQLADAIHKHDAKLGVQFGMWGPLLNLGPSAPPFPDEEHAHSTVGEIFRTKNQEAPQADFHVLTIDEILEFEKQFAECTKQLKDLGVDCVELHCSHGGATLMCAFISPYYNKRDDEYGGSWENRLRFPVETIQKMREAVGPDYPLMARIDANELLGERGILPHHAAEHIGPALEAAGIDCLDVSQGSIMHAPQGILLPMYYPEGCFLEFAETVKKAVNVPVIGVGRMMDLDVCEQALQEGKADLIHFGRQLIADPETPNKYLQQRKDEIRECIGCNEGCGLPCAINYDIGPGRMPLLPAASSKHIVVIGGGVAGMEAARVASLRGYEVTLLEKRDSLGGLVGTFRNEPTCRDLSRLTDYLTIQMEKRGVDVRLGCDASIDDIVALGPDVVILAAGAVQDIPDKLEGNPKAMDILEAIRNRESLGQKILIWGHTYGAETAISLAQEGKDVTLFGNGTRLSLLGFASNARRWWLMKKLSDIDPVRIAGDGERIEGVDVYFQSRLGEVTDTTAEIVLKDGETRVVEYDNLIVARARKRSIGLMDSLQSRVPEVYAIGDYDKVNVIQRAIFTANEVVRSLDTDFNNVEQLTREPDALM
ncbi:MAG: FAD-dependent oxidoreductase [Pseudomonadales bacterium]|nr:FAD-dependent oxidoreductase [Pseudomonadales bacterium]